MNQFKNKHRGQRCIIACNGPGLNDIDMSLLDGEIVIALNRGYLKKDMPITYMVVVNRKVEDQWGDEINKLGAKAVFSNSLSGSHILQFSPDVPSFQTDITKQMWQGHTVTYVALQIAYYMGFSKVGLIGCDHNFPHMGRKLVGDDINHFDPNYFPDGARWDLPNLARTELAYSLAKKAFESAGRHLYNCSTFTKLDVIDKMSLSSFVEKK